MRATLTCIMLNVVYFQCLEISQRPDVVPQQKDMDILSQLVLKWAVLYTPTLSSLMYNTVINLGDLTNIPNQQSLHLIFLLKS